MILIGPTVLEWSLVLFRWRCDREAVEYVTVRWSTFRSVFLARYQKFKNRVV